MNRLATFLLLSALCAPSFLMTGCAPATSDDRTNRAEERITKGDLDGARSDLDSALKKAEKEGASAEAKAALRKRMGEVDAMIAKRVITREDDSRASAAAHLQNAKRHSDNRAWKEMVREVSAAESEVKKASDPALETELRRFHATRPMMLMRAQRAYREVCRSVNWAIGTDFFEVPGSVFWEIGSYIDAGAQLEGVCAPLNDTELTEAAKSLTSNWRSCLQFKTIADNIEEGIDAKRRRGEKVGFLESAALAAARVKEVKDRIDYANARTRFEKRMKELLGGASMDAVQYAPQRRDRPAAPAAPVAAAPAAAPIPAGVPVAPGSTNLSVERQTPAASVATPPSAAPAQPIARTDIDRSKPNFDDVN